MEKIFVFLMGAIVGSFLNVCIYRIPKKESIVFPSSHCTSCNKNILWYDNIPILSYLLLRGTCRACKAKIAFRYVIVELLTALLLTGLYWHLGLQAKFFIYSILTCGLIVVTFVDFEIYEIPDEISLGGLVFGLVVSGLFPSLFGVATWKASLVQSLLGVLAGGGSIYLMGLLGEIAFKKEAMGGGDVKLMAMIGSIIGWKMVLLTFFIAPLFGSIVGLILKLKDGRQIIPYGPYLSLATLVTIFFGDKLIALYAGSLYLH